LPGRRGAEPIRLRRLAAVSGSTRTALAFALTGLTPASQRQLPPPSPAESQADRKARLFGTIRDDAARGMSIRQLAARHHVHRRMLRQTLADPAGSPPRNGEPGQHQLSAMGQAAQRSLRHPGPRIRARPQLAAATGMGRGLR
jgi:hypothetical protein